MADLFLGTQGWSYDAWVGPFYPPGTPSTEFLAHYATHFNTVELDTTFYAVPRDSTIAGWRERTPAGFRFAAKFPQSITHERQLVGCVDDGIAFLDAMTQLDQKLGPLLLQMPPGFAATQFPVLTEFLQGLPTGFRIAVELRHRSWLAEANHKPLLDLLTERGVALCLVQHAWMPHLDEVTAPFVYIRWLGRREDIPGTDYSVVRINRDSQLDTWAGQIRNYRERGLTVYGYFNNHYQGHSPASVRSLQQRLGLPEG